MVSVTSSADSKSQETGALTSKGRRRWIISALRDKLQKKADELNKEE